MVATPRFRLWQDNEFVYVEIKVPHVRVSEAETLVEGHHFSFYCKPYLLNLVLPYEVVEDDRCRAVYDPLRENGIVTAHLPKKEAGQHFPDLDLLGTLLKPAWNPFADEAGEDGAAEAEICEHEAGGDAAAAASVGKERGPLARDALGGSGIEVLSSAIFGEASDDRGSVEGEGGASESNSAAAEAGEIRIGKICYGFNNQKSEFFRHLREEQLSFCELPDPDETAPERRAELRVVDENRRFNKERYWADLAATSDSAADSDPFYVEAVAFEPHWAARGAPSAAAEEGETASELELSEAERDILARLPRREYLVPQGGVEEASLLLGLADLLFAYAYDHRFTAGESTVESAHTIAALSPALSWLQHYTPCPPPNPFADMAFRSSSGSPFEVGSFQRILATGVRGSGTPAPLADVTAKAAGVSAPRFVFGAGSSCGGSAGGVGDGGGGGSAAEADEGEDSAAAATAKARVAALRGVQAPLVWGMRRALVVPYLRTYALALLAARDVAAILAAGKRCVLRCLLQVFVILEHSETHYLLNKLFLEDYSVWIQTVHPEALRSLAVAYAAALAAVSKAALGLGLDKAEAPLRPAATHAAAAAERRHSLRQRHRTRGGSSAAANHAVFAAHPTESLIADPDALARPANWQAERTGGSQEPQEVQGHSRDST